VGCFLAATIFALIVTAKLVRLGRVDSPKPDSPAVDFKRVAVDDGGNRTRFLCHKGNWKFRD
jgi:hypothetical protein